MSYWISKQSSVIIAKTAKGFRFHLHGQITVIILEIKINFKPELNTSLTCWITVKPMLTQPCWLGLKYTDCILWTRVRTPQKDNPEYNIKIHLMVRLQFWRSEGVRSTPSLPLFPDPLWPKGVVSVRVSSVGQIDLFILGTKL